MPILRKKAGPEFEAMEFDGSFESAKVIIDWISDRRGAFWSSNGTMTFPSVCGEEHTFFSGEWVVKLPFGGIRKIPLGGYDDYEAVI